MKEEISSLIVHSALKEGATDVAAELNEKHQMMIRFSNNEITISKNYHEVLVNIFLAIEKHRAAMTIPLVSIAKLEKNVKRLIKIAKITPPTEVYAPLPKGPFTYDKSLKRPSITSLDPEKLTMFVEDSIKGALAQGATKVAGTLIGTKNKSILSTSGQVNVSQNRMGIELSVRAFTSDVASGHFVSISNNDKEFKPAETGIRAGEIAKAASNPKQGKPGKYTTLLGPLVFADLSSQIGNMASAYKIETGQSFLVDKINLEVASEKFTLIDDPTIINSYGGKAYDDEGTPTRRNYIIKKGILKTYLHNSTTAKKFRTNTTGNGGLLSPHPWNLIIEPGIKNYSELLGEIDSGIYVTNDWYLRYQNYRKGDFSTIPRDGMFLIKNGEIISSINELRISDNMLRIMNNIRDLSKSRSWIKWWEVTIPTLTPCALIEELNFTKSGM
jgi:PmbA protein